MGNKERIQDENATTSTNASRDQESKDATLAKTITIAVTGETLTQQKSEETQSIAEEVSLQTKSITETFQRQMEKTHAQYEELLKASCAQNFPSTLKVTSSSEGFK